MTDLLGFREENGMNTVSGLGGGTTAPAGAATGGAGGGVVGACGGGGRGSVKAAQGMCTTSGVWCW